MLEAERLFVNSRKTERYHASKDSGKEWEKCKYLGSQLGTEEDIKRMMVLAHDCLKAFDAILSSKRISEQIRLRTFKQYVESVFLYNSEIWTLTKTLENKIDAFQRRLLRTVIHVKWTRTISNKRLYERTEYQPWSITILKRSLTWFGHLLRIPTDTPAQQALKCFIKPPTRSIGRPKTTWLDTVIKNIRDFSDINLTQDLPTNIDRLKFVCSDRKAWHKTVGSIMSTRLTNIQ